MEPGEISREELRQLAPVQVYLVDQCFAGLRIDKTLVVVRNGGLRLLLYSPCLASIFEGDKFFKNYWHAWAYKQRNQGK